MNIVIITAVVMCVGVLAVLVKLLRGMSAAGRNLPVTADWIDEISIERYRPMLRMLDGAELESLRSQPGFTPQAAARLRSQRCRIFRGYLQSLSLDFGRICGALKLLMVQSQQDRPDLAAALIRQQFLFACGVLTVEVRLALYRVGLCGVDVTDLIRIFEHMRLELRILVPATVGSRA